MTKQLPTSVSGNAVKMFGNAQVSRKQAFKLRIYQQIDFTQYIENIYASNDKQSIPETDKIRLL